MCRVFRRALRRAAVRLEDDFSATNLPARRAYTTLADRQTALAAGTGVVSTADPDGGPHRPLAAVRAPDYRRADSAR